MDFLTTLVHLLDFIAAYNDLVQGEPPVYDLAGWAALAVFIGGIVFWLILIFAAVVGVSRGIKRAFDSASDVIRSHRRVEPAE